MAAGTDPARSLALERAENRGMTAAVRRTPYGDNPHSDAALRLAWSRGHNGMRAKMAMDAFGSEGNAR